MKGSRSTRKKHAKTAGSSIGLLFWCSLVLGLNVLIISDAISLGEDGYWGVRPSDISQEQLGILIWIMPLNLFLVGTILVSPYALYCHLRGRTPDFTPVEYTDNTGAKEAIYNPLPFFVWAYVMMFPVSLGAIFLSIVLGAFLADDFPVYTYIWIIVGIVFVALCVYKLGWNLANRFRIRVEGGSVSIGDFSDIPVHNVTRLHCVDALREALKDDGAESNFTGRQYSIFLIDHSGQEQIVELPRIRPTQEGKRLGKWMEEQLML